MCGQADSQVGRGIFLRCRWHGVRTSLLKQPPGRVGTIEILGSYWMIPLQMALDKARSRVLRAAHGAGRVGAGGAVAVLLTPAARCRKPKYLSEAAQ